MIHTLKKLLIHNAPLKIISLICGCTFWYFFSQYHTHTMHIQVPLCFDKQHKDIIDAPDTVTVTLSGSRATLRSIDQNSLAVHIAKKYDQPGQYHLGITPAMLLLPASIKLVHYTPIPITITVKETT